METRRLALQNSVTSDLESAKRKGGLSQQEAMQLMLKMMCLEKLTPKNKAAEDDEDGEDEDARTTRCPLRLLNRKFKLDVRP